jgi:hypothetical protein
MSKLVIGGVVAAFGIAAAIQYVGNHGKDLAKSALKDFAPQSAPAEVAAPRVEKTASNPAGLAEYVSNQEPK